MLFSEMEKAVSGNHLVKQLLNVKRCFGNNATVGIVTTPGNFDCCSTVTELVAFGHVPSGLEWIDPFLAGIPCISELSADDFVVTPPRYLNGPPCPYDVAKREQEAARARAKEQRTNQSIKRKSKMRITMTLTNREVELLRNSTSDLGLSDVECVSLQLKIANAILDASSIKLNDIGIPILPTQVSHGKQ